ncbi:lipopolysaccharide biosynthesis protein [Marinobacter subterrani]|uniref:lipopolysaccharide biosynthesis protein n=1 Tax=Marinobacter subterrani TaxID=1658765 RepID=UPI002351FAB1|nr:lipopolysaccharide biosynthesis protein [Marinobacter subterrani]
MSDFRGRVLTALSWTAGGKMISQVISVGFGIALARMLTPDDFGLIAMMMVFTGFAGLLMDVGLGSALVQKKDVKEIHYNTVFWTNLGLGASLSCIVYFSSPFIAAFYGRNELIVIGHILSLQFTLGALALVPRQRLVKNLTFKVVVSADLIGMIVAGISAIIMVYAGFGYWALAWQPVILRMTATIYIWSVAKWLPSLAFSREALKELFGFSFYVFASTLLQYASRQVDKLLVGKYLGGDALGILEKARSMMLFPLQNVSNVVGSVMFPALSAIQSEKERVRSVFLRSTQGIALLTFPMIAGVYVVSESFVLGVLGEQWRELIPILKMLCFVGIPTSIVAVNGPVYLSQGKAKLQFKVKLLTRPIAIVCVLVGLQWGLEGIVLGVILSGWINSIITLKISGSLINLPLYVLIQSLAKALVCAVLMAMLLILADPYLASVSQITKLLIQIILGAIIYLTLVLLIRPPATTELIAMIRSRIGK